MNDASRELSLLLIEDSKEDVLLFRRAIAKTGLGARLLVAPNGKVAIDLLSQPEQTQGVDIVFLDLKMPMVSGFEVLQWIQRQNFHPRLHVVVLSGSPHEADQALARELGAADYVVKPIAVEYLRHRLLLLMDNPVHQA